MRRNKYQEAYCGSKDEVLRELNRKDEDASLVYAAKVLCVSEVEAPCYEVLRNYDGETILYVEHDNYESCLAILNEVGIEVME